MTCRLVRPDEFHSECSCGDWHMIQVLPDIDRVNNEWLSHKAFRKSLAETARRLVKRKGGRHEACNGNVA